jgi:hypothetical protein
MERMSPRVKAALISIVLLIPCFWQRRIQAVDLGSHIYNSWLTQQIELGKAPGLVIAPITTNVLFDIILSRLYEAFGAEPAQHIAVALSVLIFFWGAFAFISQVNGGRRWFLVPCLMMLSYGWVFHMGFSNYYLACGLSLWALALSVRRRVATDVAAVVLLAVAYTAHAIPVLWAVFLIAYSRIAEKLSWRSRLLLWALSAASIVALQQWITHSYGSFSSFHQVLEASGVDQFWVFGLKYIAISVGLGTLWGFLLLRMSHLRGFQKMFGDTYFQLGALTALGILLIPTRIELPQYHAALSFVTERMTLLHGVLICVYLAAAEPPRWMRIAFIPLAVIYFSFIYVDTNALNRVEQQMENLTSGLSLQDRAVTSFEDPTSRVQLWGHNIDRVCLGRCVSYANYEPASWQFRVRAVAPGPLVMANPLDGGMVQSGGYRVKESDLPMYQITQCDSDLCLRKLNPGDVIRHDPLIATPLLW